MSQHHGELTPSNNLRLRRSLQVGSLILLLLVAISLGMAAYLAVGDVGANTEELLLYGIAGASGVAALGILIFAVWTIRSIMNPLHEVREQTQELGEGNMDIELDVERADEVGDVNKAFIAMRDELQNQNGAIHRRDQELHSFTETYTNVMNQAAQGDFTVRMNTDYSNDNLQHIATTFNAMMDEIEETIVETKEFTEAVTAQTSDLAEYSETAINASEEINRTAVSAIAGKDGDGADEDFEYTGRDFELDTITKEEIIMTEETIGSIEELEQKMGQITEVTEFILDIASETNMLALNAGIEASKVEEGAEGFEVVADEIKDLAEDTKQSVDEIEEINDEVRDVTNDAVQQILRQYALLLHIMSDQANDLIASAQELRRSTEDLQVSTEEYQQLEG